MKDTFLSARLVEENLIRLTIFSSVPFDRIDGNLVVDEKTKIRLVPLKQVSLGNQIIIDYKFNDPLELGHSYKLFLNHYGVVPLDVSEAPSFPDFDLKFSYEGDDLGAIYSPKETKFALWAPLASDVTLKISKNNETKATLHKMERTSKGVFRLTLKGDYEKANYLYLVTNSESTISSIDPYAKASTPNGEKSVVADFSKLKISSCKEKLPAMNSACDAIVYEGHVRDLTIDPCTDIENKGKFLGLIERNRKTPNGHPAGFDYLKNLGITHLQLQPLQDYATVDELHPDLRYNWGYDPAQYFVPEGSFASDVSDPYSRIRECLEMIKAFHEEGIRIVIDVVYNHIYEYEYSAYEKIVPNYYFRHRRDGKMANTSGCGDDLASERPMVEKLILDSAKWWIEFYEVDGFRFDLSGILTAKVVNEIVEIGKAYDPYFIAYGEGWNMGGEVNEPLATMGNYYMLPKYGFFNDKYREGIKRYASGDLTATDDAKFGLIGSSLDFCGRKMFLNPCQSVNYVECHDNGTYFDYLSKNHPDFSINQKLGICLFAESIILTSAGIPFIHAGQELGQSKWMNDNTYNAPDYFNRLSYKLVDERFEMVKFLKGLIKLRKKIAFLHNYNTEILDRYMDLNNYGDLVVMTIEGEENASPYSKIHFFYNPLDVELVYISQEEETIIFDFDRNLLATREKEIHVPPHRFVASGVLLEK